MGYQSRYGGSQDLTFEKYIVELMCERKAKKEKKTLLDKFWNNDYWKKFYVQQIIAIKSLTKVYSEKAILNGINNKAVSWVYSLRSPQLLPIIADEENKIAQQIKLQEEKKVIDSIPKEALPETVKVEKPRQATPAKQSILNKLRDL